MTKPTQSHVSQPAGRITPVDVRDRIIENATELGLSPHEYADHSPEQVLADSFHEIQPTARDIAAARAGMELVSQVRRLEVVVVGATSDARWREFDQVPGRKIDPIPGFRDRQRADSVRVHEVTVVAARRFTEVPSEVSEWESEGGSVR